jgi:hypothetical protein
LKLWFQRFSGSKCTEARQQILELCQHRSDDIAIDRERREGQRGQLGIHEFRELIRRACT